MKLGEAKPFKIEVKQFAQEELYSINKIIELLSKGTFSPALVSSIVKTPTMYQFMQADILQVLQSRMDDSLAEDFVAKAKDADRKSVV